MAGVEGLLLEIVTRFLNRNQGSKVTRMYGWAFVVVLSISFSFLFNRPGSRGCSTNTFVIQRLSQL